MNRFFILMGSNTNSALNLDAARLELSKLFGANVHYSDTILSSNTEYADDKNLYSNIVCTGLTKFDAEEVVGKLKAIENVCGRLRGALANGEVSIDLDLVEWNNSILKAKDASQNYYRDCKLNVLQKIERSELDK
jgi:2-amino-4-hydroxy-6-hydroxymethyldihydropteridine diphosphokinase